METITVHVNDRAVSLTAQSTITDLIRELNIPPLGIAVAVSPSPGNNAGPQEQDHTPEIVPQRQWPDFTLSDRQDILIIQATQGG